LGQAGGRRARGFPSGGIDRKVEAGGEAQGAQNPEIVFLKSLRRISHRPDQLSLEVPLALEGVPPLVPERMIGNGIDREVAPGQVILQRHPVCHHGVTSIRGHVAAEGGDLVQLSAMVENPHRTVLHAYRDRAAKEPLHLFRRGRRSDVMIGLRVTE
jgi:hypothetical protein